MSEFKFACPVCGQHITADSKDTGSQISCPTCFRKIIVPQAPVGGDPKFVLSASEANKPRPVPAGGNPQQDAIQRTPRRMAWPILMAVLVLLCAVGATVFAFREKIFHPAKSANAPQTTNDVNHQAQSPRSALPPMPDYTGPSLWTLNLSEAKIPDSPAAGAIHQKAFTCERASITGSNLMLRAGRGGPAELGLNVFFFNRQPEELSRKTIEIKSTDPIAPRVLLRWREEDRRSEKAIREGYAMRVEFGPVSNNAIPGKIFISLPDESKSWVAGTFRAEIRRPSPPRPGNSPGRQ